MALLPGKKTTEHPSANPKLTGVIQWVDTEELDPANQDKQASFGMVQALLGNAGGVSQEEFEAERQARIDGDLSPEQKAQVDALTGIVYRFNSSGDYESYTSFEASVAPGTEDCVIVPNRGIVDLAAHAELGGGTLRGGGVVIQSGANKELRVTGGNTFIWDINLACTFRATGGTTYFNRARIGGPLIAAAGAVIRLNGCSIDAEASGAGLVILEPGVTASETFFGSLTNNGDGTYSTAEGGTILDQRGGGTSGPTVPTLDPYNVPLAIRQAVVDGFNAQDAANNDSPFLAEPQPDGSKLGMEFIDPDAQYLYKFRPVAFADGTYNVWISNLLSR